MQQKLNALLALLSSQREVLVHLDPRHVEVCLPDHLKDQYQVVLAVGYNMPNPILNLDVDIHGIYGIFSFRGSPRQVFIPLHRIFAVIGKESQKGAFFGEACPPEVRAAMLGASAAPETVVEVPTTSAGNVVSLADYKRRKLGR